MVINNRKKRAFCLVLVFFVMILLILIAEGTVRLRQYIKYGTASHFNKGFYIDKITGLRLPEPGMETASIKINSLGFRGQEITKLKPNKQHLRISFVGGSTTYCSEVSSNKAVWTELVSKGLESSIPGLTVDYINGGIPGYTSANSIINFQKRILPLQPDILVIYHATNDLSMETKKLAHQAGIQRISLKQKESWLSRYSLLSHLIEKNINLMLLQKISEPELLDLNYESIGDQFQKNLKKLVAIAYENDVKLVVFVTFSIHLRDGMTKKQQLSAMTSSNYYMPYLSSSDLLTAFKRYNQIIREVALSSDSLLVEHENSIPGDTDHFHDSVHFTDLGSKLQAERVIAALLNSTEFEDVIGEMKAL